MRPPTTAKKTGIPGQRYADQDSRGTQEVIEGRAGQSGVAGPFAQRFMKTQAADSSQQLTVTKVNSTETLESVSTSVVNATILRDVAVQCNLLRGNGTDIDYFSAGVSQAKVAKKRTKQRRLRRQQKMQEMEN